MSLDSRIVLFIYRLKLDANLWQKRMYRQIGLKIVYNIVCIMQKAAEKNWYSGWHIELHVMIVLIKPFSNKCRVLKERWGTCACRAQMQNRLIGFELYGK